MGDIPSHIYEATSNPENKVFFDDPITYKDKVESLLKRPIRIYTAGKDYPPFSYLLISYDEDYEAIGPSGLFAIPTPSFVFHPDKLGEKRYKVSARNVAQVFNGAVVPSGPVAAKPVKKLMKLPELNKTQAELFAAHPGVHYSILCRVVVEEDSIKEIIQRAFPEVDLDDIFTNDSYDAIQVAAYWISTLGELKKAKQRKAVVEIKALIAAVKERRRASGSPIGDPQKNDLMTLLAMQKPDMHTVLQQIAEMPVIEYEDRKAGYTPLMLAARMGHTEAVHALLARNANPNSRDFEGSTPLIFACSAGNPEICMTLLSVGADPSLQSVDGTTALLAACSEEDLVDVIFAILSRGVDPNVSDQEKDTPLHIAASNGLTAVIGPLLGAGGNPNSQNEDGKTPLMLAIEEGEEAVVAILIPVTDLGLRTTANKTALGIAIDANQDDMAVALIQGGTIVKSWTIVHKAAVTHRLHKLAELVKHRASSSERRRTRTNRVKKNSSSHRRTSSSHH